MAIDLERAPFEVNLAEQLDQSMLDSIGSDLVEQVEIDEDSRKEWMETNKEWLKLASQVREEKSFPWPGASNVKYPLLTIASMQFHARALPNLVNSAEPVKTRVIGRDPDGVKRERGNRVSKYMSYQILEGMDDWMDEMDRLLFILPMTGICYKKTFFSEVDGMVKSSVVLPNDLIVNYHARSFKRARMTQVIYKDSNEILELQRKGIYSDVDVVEQETEQMNRNARDDILEIHPIDGSDMDAQLLYESHCFLDLDEDGYKEPYIVTLTKTGKVLRIVARWSNENIQYNDRGEVARIEPEEYFTPYIFMPDPSSAVSGLGLGSVLGPLNESVNTITNQLIDAGTLSNMQGGFLGRGIRMKGGAMRFRPGEWKIVNSTAEDISKSIYPMPVKEPSGTLFNLLSLLIESGERVSAVSDMMVGENPGQNQAATTTMAVLEQGLMVFSTIQKRIHRALAREYKNLLHLYSIYLNEDDYNAVLDETLLEDGEYYTVADFNETDMDIRPASDPAIVSQAQRSVKSQALIEKLSLGMPLNVQEVTRRTLEAEEHEDIDVLMDVPAPQPDPQIELDRAKFQHEAEMAMQNSQRETVKVRAQAIKDLSGAALNDAKAQQAGASVMLDVEKLGLEKVKTGAEIAEKADNAEKESADK